jgi:hypothetical protein
MALTKPLRERLIERGIVIPSTEKLATWTDYRGVISTERPLMLPDHVARLKRRLLKSGVIVPFDMVDESEIAPVIPIRPIRRFLEEEEGRT